MISFEKINLNIFIAKEFWCKDVLVIHFRCKCLKYKKKTTEKTIEFD